VVSRLPILTLSGDYLSATFSASDARVVRCYWQAVSAALAGNAAPIGCFATVTVHDRAGTVYYVLTDLDHLYRCMVRLSDAKCRRVRRILGPRRGR